VSGARTGLVLVIGLLIFPGVLWGSRVEVLVNDDLYASGEIDVSLDRYLADIRQQGYEPILTPAGFSTAAELKTHLSNRYDEGGLAGAVLIGEMPAPLFEIEQHTGWEYESFPCDLYLQDLTGNWADTDGDGLLDEHTGNVAPEIWLGRMAVGALVSLHTGRSEAGLLNGYFAKNHAYRTGQFTCRGDALAYVDDDWRTLSDRWVGELELATAGEVHLVDDGPTTAAADYRARLQEEYEHLFLAAHSAPIRHGFKVNGDFEEDRFRSSEVAEVDPKVLFYALYACSAARYDTEGYIAGEYVFGTGSGLLALGSTKTGGIQNYREYYDQLGQGRPFAEALEHWWTTRASGGFTVSQRDWLYGVTLIGDPLLVAQAFIPEPASIRLLACAAVFLLLGSSRRNSSHDGVPSPAA